MNSESFAEAPNTAMQLLKAYRSNDSDTFAEIAGRLVKSKERKPTAEHLVGLVGPSDFQLVEMCVVVLMITGMAWEYDCAERLINSARRIFTPDVLTTFVRDEKARLLEKADCKRKRMSFGIRLLRGTIYMAARAGTPQAAGFISFIEDELFSTPLGSSVAKWKSLD